MAKELRCRDIGMDCDEVIHGETEEEVLEKAAKHAGSVHEILEIDAEMLEQIRAAIRTV